MASTFKDLARIHIQLDLSSSSQATNLLIHGMNIKPHLVRAVEATKNGVPCDVTWYCDFTAEGISSVTAITVTGSYNIGYRGEGPGTLLDHMKAFGFLNDMSRATFENLVFGSKEHFYYEK